MSAEKPPYVVHVVAEEDVTVDWFFGDRPLRAKLGQLVLVAIGWVFAILPVVILFMLIEKRLVGGLTAGSVK